MFDHNRYNGFHDRRNRNDAFFSVSVVQPVVFMVVS